jgi:hypothetical protein
MPMYRWINANNNNQREPREVMKGDLQMRATVVYHYKRGDNPIACISSYYDPTDSVTAKNQQGLPGGAKGGMSNNGINYPPRGRTVDRRLQRQANMVFPDGRLANPALHEALGKAPGDYTLADKAAIDAANCALSILDGATPGSSRVPNFALQERAFLDARQVKSLHKPDRYRYVDPATGTPQTQTIDRETKLVNLTDPEHLKLPELQVPSVPQALQRTKPDYDLPIEQRQPLEIRVTEIDLGLLKGVQIAPSTNGAGSNNDNTEYLLPNSGIIYATRDDALPDISDPDSPATDFRVDHTRHPMGIRLVNGENLERKPRFRTPEKGLILASNLPVYIKGNFNLHRPSGTAGADRLEEFTEPLDDNYGNFYQRQTNEPRFACRTGQDGCRAPGDQWRAARILSDAITLLSENFRDGYRIEGGYDLNNNAGNSVVEARLNKGFWWNSFATTANWYKNSDGQPRDNFDPDLVTLKRDRSSYVTNSVTPIQRRVNFPVYKMEICRRLPVSECDPNGTNGWIADANSRDTATVPPKEADQHFARRVAFKRDDQGYGQLVLETSANPKGYAIPMRAGGPTGTELPYSSYTTPVKRNNALWFATSPLSDSPYNSSNPFSFLTENANNPLYYLPDEPEVPTPPGGDVPVVHERQLLLPGTPIFPADSPTIIAAGGATAVRDLNKLNGNSEDDPSDYSVCIPGKGASKGYKSPTLANDPACTAAKQRIDAARTVLLALQPSSDINPPTPVPRTGTGVERELSPTDRVNVIPLPKDIQKLELTLKRNPAQKDPIVILRNPDYISFNGGVVLKLQGVDPNNVFWVSGKGIYFQIRNLAVANNQLAGNFIGGTAGNSPLYTANDPQIIGGRFLGFNKRQGALSTNFQALTTTNQPLLVPILQLHSPTGNPGAPFSGTDDLELNWLQHATPTTFNASFIMGNTPARPFPGNAVNPGESGGGLHNFPRFLEAWEVNRDTKPETSTKIKGSFIQFKRSSFATAPFETIDDPTKDNSLFFDRVGGGPAYMAGYATTQFRYRGGAQNYKAPFYRPPNRLWGYDVGLLKQTPDLFSRRFALPAAGTPSEFYREVSRDDDWIKTLLCAAEPRNPNAQNPIYDWAISDEKQRPASCQNNTPGPQYYTNPDPNL